MPRHRSPRSKAGKLTRGIIKGILLGAVALETVHLRRRLAALVVLDNSPAEPTGGARRAVRAEGVTIDPATLAAAQGHADAEDLATLDLVPADLPVAQAMDLLRDLDPASYRTDRHALGRGGWHAVLSNEKLLDAAGVPDTSEVTAAELAKAVVELKLHAPADTGIAVAPGLGTSAAVLAKDLDILRAVHRSQLGTALSIRLVWLAGLAASGLLGPGWALLLLGAWSAQPAAVFAGSKTLRPKDLARASLTRAVSEPRRLLSALTAVERLRSAGPDPVERSRPRYRADLEAGLGRFFEPVRQDCPWCGSTELSQRLVTRDIQQGKPGVFRLDECRSCRHVFQNPRLNAAGLEFYYRDFYDGLGEDFTQSAFGQRRGYFRGQAETMVPFAKPERWLDVGTGHAHFCNAARAVWPQTTFDGLDFSEGIEVAQRRGWIERGHHGFFPELAPGLAEQYDMVSMFHYLEHSTDPRAELKAAWQALKPGGHLMIEVPDPECRLGRILGEFWISWLQPQHLHFVPVANLRTALAEQGFTVVAELHAEAHQPVEFMLAAYNVVNTMAPAKDLPWRPTAPTVPQRVGRVATFAAGVPLMAAASLVDRALNPVAERFGLTQAYRVVAQKK